MLSFCYFLLHTHGSGRGGEITASPTWYGRDDRPHTHGGVGVSRRGGEITVSHLIQERWQAAYTWGSGGEWERRWDHRVSHLIRERRQACCCLPSGLINEWLYQPGSTTWGVTVMITLYVISKLTWPPPLRISHKTRVLIIVTPT